MPRIYKGSETILKLLIDVPSTSVIDKIKIALFTTDRSIAMEFYADSITLYGNIAYLNAPEWTFMEMQDGIINYIAQGESDNKPFIFERQSNYILKSSDGFEMSEIMNGYYTKEETDVKLEAEQDKLVSGKTIKTINGESVLGSGNIAVATEQWVRRQGYVTDSDVNDYVGNEIGQIEERFNDYYTKPEVDDLINNIDIPEGTGGDSGVYVLEPVGDLESRVEKQITDKTTWESTIEVISRIENYQYEGSDRQAHNASVFQAYKEGKVKSLFMKYKFGVDTIWGEQIETETTYETEVTYKDTYVFLPVKITKLPTDDTYTINGTYQPNESNGIYNTQEFKLGFFEDGTNTMNFNNQFYTNPTETYQISYDNYTLNDYSLDYGIAKDICEKASNTFIRIQLWKNVWGDLRVQDIQYIYPQTKISEIYNPSDRTQYKTYTIWGMYDDNTIIKWHYDSRDEDEYGWINNIKPEYITLGGGGSSEGGSTTTIVELSGSKPTLDEFNTLYESASAGIPTYVKYNDGMFAIIADYSSITNRGLYHLYFEDFDTYNVFWYNQANSSSISVVKAKVAHGADGVKNILTPLSKNDMSLLSTNVEVGTLPTFLKTTLSGITVEAPLSISNKKKATMLLDGKMYYWDFTDDSTLDANGIGHKAKVVDLLNISSNGSSEGGSDGVILEYPQNVDNYTYTMNHLTGESEDWETNTDAYVGSERMSKNAEFYQRIWNGEVTSVYMKYKYNSMDVSLGFSDDGTKEYIRSEHYYTIIPLSFHKDENENCIIFNSVFSKPYDTTYRLQFIMRENGNVYYYDWSEETVGGSSDGTTELHSPVIYGEMQFQEDYGSYEDTASGVACGFKMNRANINNIWVKELHLGTGGETVKVTSPMSNVDGNEEIVYAEFTTTGIKENGQYLSDKYVLKSDYDALLARIEALENK